MPTTKPHPSNLRAGRHALSMSVGKFAPQEKQWKIAADSLIHVQASCSADRGFVGCSVVLVQWIEEEKSECHRGFQLEDLSGSGSIEELTHIQKSSWGKQCKMWLKLVFIGELNSIVIFKKIVQKKVVHEDAKTTMNS